jgi:hypothetical protein
MADSAFYIYVLFRENGFPFYVGKGKGSRWTQHEWKSNRENSRKRAAIEQILAAGIDVPKIKLHENLTEETARAYEKALIAAIGRDDKGVGPLVNMTDGGEGISGYKHTPEYSARMSALRKGRKQPTFSKKHRAKISESARNRSPEHAAKLLEAARNRSPEWREKNLSAARNRLPEWRAKLSAIKKGKKLSPESYAKGAAKRRGLKRSAETRAKQSAAMKGKNRGPLSAEHRAKISAQTKGKPKSPETIARMRAFWARRKLTSSGAPA